MNQIRNFVIIAHIDHGKSTLADRFLEVTGTVSAREMKPQYLDQLELERERGITIKMAPVRMIYRPKMKNVNIKLKNDNEKLKNNSPSADTEILNFDFYILNLIDTPGHADFSYEVSRALAAVEGAILLVDATQGIQAQTLANYETAKRAGLFMIGAVNKIDVADPAQVEETAADLAELLGVSKDDLHFVSGKTGKGVEGLLQTVAEKVPPPQKFQVPVPSGAARALIFDSLFHDHKGVIAFIRVTDGVFRSGETVHFAITGANCRLREVGTFSPRLTARDSLSAGEIGYLATGIKDAGSLRIGDTVLQFPAAMQSGRNEAISKEAALPGYREPKPVVFVAFYPEDASEYDDLRQALLKLRLTDAALQFEPDSSEVLGRGFKGGFLGRLHFEITAERLEREFGIRTTHSFPSVAYQVARKARVPRNLTPDNWETITNPKDFPDDYARIQEPMTRVEILTPLKYLSPALELKDIFRFRDIVTDHRGSKVLITARLPLADLVSDLDDKLKSVSAGFASLNYEIVGYEDADVAKLDILVATHPVPGLTRILPRKDLEREARAMVERLKELLPKQQFAQAIQASTSGRVIARETIPAMKKELGNFGKNSGDRTRKMKLWKKQARGKERLKAMAVESQVTVPAALFRELLKK